MCEASYIDKEQLKNLKLEKLLKKWDEKHYNELFSPHIYEWENNSKEYYKNKYKEELVKRLDISEEKLKIQKNIIRYYFNELDKVSSIKVNKNLGYWYCYIEEDSFGILQPNYSDIFTEDYDITFTQFKKLIKIKIINRIENFMRYDNKKIVKYISNSMYEDIKCDFKISFKYYRKEESGYGDWNIFVKFNKNMF